MLRRQYSRANYWIPTNSFALVVALRGSWILSLLWGMPLAMIATLLFFAAGAGDLRNVVGGLFVSVTGLISAGALIAVATGLAVRWVPQAPAHSQMDSAIGGV